MATTTENMPPNVDEVKVDEKVKIETPVVEEGAQEVSNENDSKSESKVAPEVKKSESAPDTQTDATSTDAASEGSEAADETVDVDDELLTKVKDQVDFYFGDSNFRRDKFMQSQAKTSKEGYIPISVLLTFNRLKSITTNSAVVRKAVKESAVVKLSDDGEKLCRREPLAAVTDSKNRTIYFQGLDKAATLEQLQNAFTVYGKVSYVKMFRDRKSKEFIGEGFVEFETEDVAKAAVEDKGAKVKVADKSPERVTSLKQFRDEVEEKKAAEKSAKKGKGSSEKVEGASEDETGKKDKEYEKGVVLHLTELKDGVSREDMKEVFGTYGEVAFVDFSRGQKEGYVRMQTAAGAKAAAEATNHKLQGGDVVVSVLSGDDEEAYFQKVREFRKRKENSRDRNKGGKRRRRDGDRNSDKKQKVDE